MSDLYAYDLYGPFKEECRSIFRFLENEYGCSIVGMHEDEHSVAVTYANLTTGVKVGFEPRENFISVYLIRLVDGQVPEYIEAPSRWFYLDQVIRLRSPSSIITQKEPGEWIGLNDMRGILTRYAEALQEYADDVLHGDFSIFAVLA